MRLVVVLTALAALLLPATALAAGPSYVAQGGLGVLSSNGKYRFIAVPTGANTAIERVAVHGGAVSGWATLDGDYGIPQPTMRPGRLEGLSRDGKQLLVGTVGLQSPTRFAVIDTRNLHVRDRFAIPGSFAYDALSPDGKSAVRHAVRRPRQREPLRRTRVRPRARHACFPGASPTRRRRAG